MDHLLKTYLFKSIIYFSIYISMYLSVRPEILQSNFSFSLLNHQVPFSTRSFRAARKYLSNPSEAPLCPSASLSLCLSRFFWSPSLHQNYSYGSHQRPTCRPAGTPMPLTMPGFSPSNRKGLAAPSQAPLLLPSHFLISQL